MRVVPVSMTAFWLVPDRVMGWLPTLIEVIGIIQYWAWVRLMKLMSPVYKDELVPPIVN